MTERIETVEGPVSGMKSFREEEDESTSQSEVKVDLEGWADVSLSVLLRVWKIKSLQFCE